MTRPNDAASAATELQQALWAWKGHCVEGTSALSARDTDALQRALAAREALQPRIGALVGSIQQAGGAPAEVLAAVQRLHSEAAAADNRLVALLTTERARLRSDMDGLSRPSAPASAYAQATGEKVHRLDIVR